MTGKPERSAPSSGSIVVCIGKRTRCAIAASERGEYALVVLHNSYLTVSSCFTLVPTVSVGMQSATLRVGPAWYKCGRGSVQDGIPTETVGTS